MKFYTYTNLNLNIDFKTKDEGRGIIGTISNLPEPIAEFSSLESAIEQCDAYLVGAPDETVLVADEEARVHRILLCKPYHTAINRLERQQCIAWAFFAFAIGALLMTWIHPILGVVFLVVSCTSYTWVIKAKITNAFEGAVTSFIIGFLTAGLFAAILRL